MGRTIGLTFEDLEPEQEVTPELHICPHCSKEYKTVATLKAHCKKEHPQAGDDTEE